MPCTCQNKYDENCKDTSCDHFTDCECEQFKEEARRVQAEERQRDLDNPARWDNE